MNGRLTIVKQDRQAGARQLISLAEAVNDPGNSCPLQPPLQLTEATNLLPRQPVVRAAHPLTTQLLVAKGCGLGRRRSG